LCPVAAQRRTTQLAANAAINRRSTMENRASKSARLLLAGFILASCIGCDQATKRLATEQLRGAPTQSYLAGIARLQFAQNPGGFLSVGEQLSQPMRFALFTLGNLAFLAAIAGFLARRWNMRLALYVGLLLLLAGGTGNLIDRLFHQGRVVDFLILGTWPIQTGIINFADIALTAGAMTCTLIYCRAAAKA
jgi:signal peptidase II